MTDVYLIGVGMTPFGRSDRSVKQLVDEALTETLKDAGAAKTDVEAAFFGNAGQAAMERQFMVPGQIALHAAGLRDIPIHNVENACASGSSAFALAVSHLRAGEAEVALAVGVDKLVHDDKALSFALFDGAWDVHEHEASLARLLALGHGVSPPPGRETPESARSVFMDIYAALAREHMRRFGTTERQLAEVAAKNHRHGLLNPKAQRRRAMTADDVLAARIIAWPLTLPMCAPVSDGAAAAILCTKDALARFPAARPVRVAACVIASASGREAEDSARHVTHTASRKAYERAGLGPEDMSLAEVHDATAFAEILQVENLGFCPIGEGGSLTASGATALGGRIPVNPSGGLECKGHPIGATGLAQLYELTTQLRGEAGDRQVENARHAIAENGGGFLGFEEAAASIIILSKADA